MIQFIGESELIFSTESNALTRVKKHLKQTMVQFDVLSHQLSNEQHLLRIKFIFQIYEKQHCRSMDDYMSYAFSEHKHKLPPYTRASYVKVFDISPIRNSPSNRGKKNTRHYRT